MAIYLLEIGINTRNYGRKRERRNYSRVKTNVELPNLIKVQTKSFKWFVDKGLGELFRDISPIQNFTENLELYFEGYEFGDPKYVISQSKEKDMTYSMPLRVNVKLVNKDTGEIKQQKIFMGDFPMMTPTGSFIINGSEKVIIAQERQADNNLMIYKAQSKHKYTYYAEILSTIDQRYFPIKQNKVYLCKPKTKNSSYKEFTVPGSRIEVKIPAINPHDGHDGIPLFIVFKALGIVSDKEIIEIIIGDLTNLKSTDNEILNMIIQCYFNFQKTF